MISLTVLEHQDGHGRSKKQPPLHPAPPPPQRTRRTLLRVEPGVSCGRPGPGLVARGGGKLGCQGVFMGGLKRAVEGGRGRGGREDREACVFLGAKRLVWA